MLSGVKDVDLKILQNLQDKEIPLICSVNKYVRDLCNDESFWLNRFITLKHVDIFFIRQMKGNFKYKELYRFFHFGEEEIGIREAAKRDNLYVYKYLLGRFIDYTKDTYPKPILESLKLASANGSIDIMSYMFMNQPNNLENLSMIISRSANLETFIWLEKMDKINNKEYIINLIHTENIPKRMNDYINETDADESDQDFLYEIGKSLGEFDLSNRINILNFFIKKLEIKNLSDLEPVIRGAEESKADVKKIEQWISYIRSLSFKK